MGRRIDMSAGVSIHHVSVDPVRAEWTCKISHGIDSMIRKRVVTQTTTRPPDRVFNREGY